VAHAEAIEDPQQVVDVVSRGTLCSSTGPSMSSDAARIGSAPFLLPETRMEPLRPRPPRILIRSMVRPSAARAAWDDALTA